MSDKKLPILIDPPKSKRPTVKSVKASKSPGQTTGQTSDPIIRLIFPYEHMQDPLEQNTLDKIRSIQLSIVLTEGNGNVLTDENNLGTPVLIPGVTIHPINDYDTTEFSCYIKHESVEDLNNWLSVINDQKINVSILYNATKDNGAFTVVMDTFSKVDYTAPPE